MEDLLLNDASFEVYSNSDGARILARNRVLMDYPDEKNSFDVFLGFTDTNKDGKDDKTGKTKQELEKDKKPKKPIFTEANIQKGAELITSGVQTGQAISGAVKSFQTEEQKAIRQKCGIKPLLKKNRKTYNACVQDYMNSLGGGSTGGYTGEDTGGKKSTMTDESKKSNTTTYIIIGVVAVALLGGLIYLKKTGKI